MSKRIITVDPNLFKSSASKASRKSKKSFNKTNKADKAHNVNYEKLLGKIKEMKKHKLQQTKKKKLNIVPQPVVQPPSELVITPPSLQLSNNINTENENIEITQETTFTKNTNPIIETPILVETPKTSLETTILPVPAPPVPTSVPAPPVPTSVAAPTSIPAPVLPLIIHPDPPYGILKNGNKPTRKNNSTAIKKNNTRFQKLRTIKRKYELGKSGKKISVLLKNNKTRKIIKGEVQKLKEKSIKEVRSFLQERNMIKAGSIAPNNVLRKMYEDMYLTGNIENKSSENLIHNYITEEETNN